MPELRGVIVGTWVEGIRAVEELLTRLGWMVVGCCEEPSEALDLIRFCRPDLVVMEGVIPFLETAVTIKDEHLAPLILYNNKSNNHFSVLIKGKLLLNSPENPDDDGKWKAAIALSREKFLKRQEIFASREKINSIETTRQVVGKARKYLSENLGISEVQAFYFIQILSHNLGISLRKAAEKIIRVYQLKEETA